MTHLKISVPVYKKDQWSQHYKDGKLEVHSDVDNLSEGYQDLKVQLDHLLLELNAQTRLAENASKLEKEIAEQESKLKKLLQDIERATAHYEDLKFFLQRFGVDSTNIGLIFDKQLLLESSPTSDAVAVEVVEDDPILFDPESEGEF